MEISAAGRLEVRITPADVGKRVSVRCLTEPGDTSAKFTDTVGVLTSWDNGVLMITRRDGRRVPIAESVLVAGKVVPAAPARRRGPAASYEELARVSSRAWRPVESEWLGEWELRAASGFTRRANSVLPLGDPGLPLDAALDAVRRWYGERGLPAYVQTATGAEDTQELLGAELERRGWTPEFAAEVWIGALAPVADRAEGAGVVLSREADESWLARYHRKGLSDVALRVLGSGPSVWFAAVPGAPGEPPTAIGRCVVDGRWAGFTAVEVDPGRRREGLATEVMSALARRALEEGASAAWLQVEDDNEGARALYTRLGFAPHHAYQHYRAPQEQGAQEGREQPGASATRPADARSSGAPSPDARPSGTGPGDARPADARLSGARPTDTGSSSTRPTDTGACDAGPSDTGSSAARPSQAGPSEAGPSEAGPSEAGPSPAGPSDGRPADAGPGDARPADPRSPYARPSDAGPCENRPSGARSS